MTVAEKQCTKCQVRRTVGDFGRRKGVPDGLTSWCRPCRSASSRERGSGWESRRAPCPGCGVSVLPWHLHDGSVVTMCKACHVVTEARCGRCKLVLPAIYFQRNSTSRTGLQSECRECKNSRHRPKRLPHIVTPPPDGVKRCGSCEVAKPVADFTKSSSSRDGLQGYCRECRSARGRARVAKSGSITQKRSYMLGYLYGATLEQYESRLADQLSACASCRKPAEETRRGRLVVDHCHRTGAIRGLLCDFNGCNGGIGMLGDDLAGVLNAVVYLARHEIGGTVDDWMPKIEALIRTRAYTDERVVVTA